MELEERMSFLNGLEKSLVEIGRDPEERMLEYLNSPLSPANKHAEEDDDLQEPEGNPDSTRSPDDLPERSAVTLPNAVDSDSDLDDDDHEDSPRSRRRLEEPLTGHELFDRKRCTFTEEKNSKVTDLSVGDLRGIIRQEVAEKAVKVGMIGRQEKRANEAGRSDGQNRRKVEVVDLDPHASAPSDRLPRNMEEAVPISLPLLYGGLSRRSPLRQKCLMIVNDKSWNIVFLLFLLANCAYIAVVPDDPSLKDGLWGTFDWVCNILYTFEILCNILAYGFIGHNAWFSVSSFHKIDFFILLATAVEVVMATQNVSGLSLKPFR